MREYLDVKFAALSAEARVIRRLERKYRDRARRLRAQGKDAERPSFLNRHMHQHRVDVVRRAARHTHLARMFLRGRRYEEVEQKVRPDRYRPDFCKVEELVAKYGEGDRRVMAQHLAAWLPAERVTYDKYRREQRLRQLELKGPLPAYLS